MLFVARASLPLVAFLVVSQEAQRGFAFSSASREVRTLEGKLQTVDPDDDQAIMGLACEYYMITLSAPAIPESTYLAEGDALRAEWERRRASIYGSKAQADTPKG